MSIDVTELIRAIKEFSFWCRKLIGERGKSLVSDCIFCRIVRKEIPAKVIRETEKVLAFADLNPEAPTHILVIPKKHIVSIIDPKLSADPELAAEIFSVIQDLAVELELNTAGMRVVVNCGSDAGETVHHLHFHIMGGRRFTWPPG